MAAPEYGRIWGGIGTYTSQFLGGLGPSHEVTILGGSETEASAPNVTMVPLTNGGGVMANYLRFQLALRRRLPDIVRQYRPDVLVVHHAQMPDLLTTARVCPVVVTTHTTIRGQALGSLAAMRHRGPLDDSEKTTLAALPALLPAERYYWQRIRHALFVSNAVRWEATSAYAPRLQTAATVPNGMSFDGIQPSAGGGEDPGFILYAGRLLGWKGLAGLLMALKHLRGPERLVVTGSGSVTPWRQYADFLGLSRDRVQFLGIVPRPELLTLLRDARVVVVPSLMESCPYSLIEAMAFGKAIVASSIPAIRDMVADEVSALLVPPANPVALAAAIDRVLEDGSLRQRLGRTAGAVARERFSAARMCSETLQYFERVISASTTSPEPAGVPFAGVAVRGP